MAAVLAGHRALGDNVMRHLIGRLNGSEANGVRAGLAQLSRTELDILAMVGAARRATPHLPRGAAHVGDVPLELESTLPISRT